MAACLSTFFVDNPLPSHPVVDNRIGSIPQPRQHAPTTPSRTQSEENVPARRQLPIVQAASHISHLVAGFTYDTPPTQYSDWPAADNIQAQQISESYPIIWNLLR